MKKLATMTALAVILSAGATFAATDSTTTTTTKTTTSATSTMPGHNSTSTTTHKHWRHHHAMRTSTLASQQKVAKDSPGSDYAVVKRDLPQGEVIETHTVTTTHPASSHRVVGSTDTIDDLDFTGDYALKTGNTLRIVGTTAYLVDGNGHKYYAPDNGYVTTRGDTYFTESGQLLRMQAAPKIMMVDTDNITK